MRIAHAAAGSIRALLAIQIAHAGARAPRGFAPASNAAVRTSARRMVLEVLDDLAHVPNLGGDPRIDLAFRAVCEIIESASEDDGPLHDLDDEPDDATIYGQWIVRRFHAAANDGAARAHAATTTPEHPTGVALTSRRRRRRDRVSAACRRRARDASPALDVDLGAQRARKS
jgi:hypothetical protein